MSAALRRLVTAIGATLIKAARPACPCGHRGEPGVTVVCQGCADIVETW